MPDPAAPRPRRWFQIHLVTCVALMFAAGGLIRQNVRMGHSASTYEIHHSSTGTHVAFAEATFYWGWPWPMNFLYRSEQLPILMPIPGSLLDERIESQDFTGFKHNVTELQRLADHPTTFSGGWDTFALALNAAVALGILLITAFVVEFALCWHSPAKTRS